MKKSIITAALLIIFSGVLTAGENNLTGAVFAPVVRDYLDLSSSANPDLPCFQIHFAGLKANAMFGGEIGAFGYFSDDFKYVLSIPAFLNLYDYAQSLVPFMLWRGSIGVRNYFEFPGLSWSKDSRLIMKFGIIHESDHYTGDTFSGSNNQYWSDFDLYFSHMNYADLGLISINNIVQKDVVFVLNIGYKYNLNNLLNMPSYVHSVRNPVNYYYGEGSITIKANNNADLYFSAYAEKIYNSPALRGSYFLFPEILSATESDYFYLNLGIKFKGSSGIAYQPFLIYSYSNGRGVDYLLREDIYGFGLRIII